MAPTLGRAPRIPRSHSLSGHLPGGVVRGPASILGPSASVLWEVCCGSVRRCQAQHGLSLCASGKETSPAPSWAGHPSPQCWTCPLRGSCRAITPGQEWRVTGTQAGARRADVLGAWLEAQEGPACGHTCGHQLCPSWYPALALGLSSLRCTQLPPVCVGLVVKSHHGCPGGPCEGPVGSQRSGGWGGKAQASCRRGVLALRGRQGLQAPGMHSGGPPALGTPLPSPTQSAVPRILWVAEPGAEVACSASLKFC